MRSFGIILMLSYCFLWSVSLFGESGAGIVAVDKAARDNKYLFLFFYKEDDEKTATAQKVFDDSMVSLAERANGVRIKVTDSSERMVVDKFGVRRAPMPMVLAVAPNGAITGGFPSIMTSQQMSDAILGRGAADCLKALQERKLVLLCLQNATTADNIGATNGVKDFQSDSRFRDATVVVLIDPQDEQEQSFLTQLSLDKDSKRAVTVVITPPADIIGKYEGSVSKEQIVSDLTKATSGCCPGGCCPGGCCPGGKS